MTLGSLFAGIGGFDLGFERAGFKTVWQVEIDPYCRKVLERHFPHAERFNDVRECGAHNLKPVDVICGGFPCQDISNAGKRAGIEGERSGLWSEYARIIGELRPSYVVVENVAALLGRGMGRVLGDLAEIGYDAEWGVVSAADAGAPQIRERVWILAHSRYPEICERGRDCDGRAEGIDLRGIPRNDFAWKSELQAEILADTERLRQLQPQGGQQDERRWASNGGEDVSHPNIIQEVRSAIARGERGDWCPEPNVGRVAHGIPARVDRLKGLGNAVVPQIPEMIARRILEASA